MLDLNVPSATKDHAEDRQTDRQTDTETETETDALMVYCLWLKIALSTRGDKINQF